MPRGAYTTTGPVDGTYVDGTYRSCLLDQPPVSCSPPLPSAEAKQRGASNARACQLGGRTRVRMSERIFFEGRGQRRVHIRTHTTVVGAVQRNTTQPNASRGAFVLAQAEARINKCSERVHGQALQVGVGRCGRRGGEGGWRD